MSELAAADIEVVHNEAARRFEARVGSKTAVLDYRLGPGEIAFTHTGVPREFEGRGIGSKLVRAGLDYAREHKLKVIPLCPFVAWYLQDHPQDASN